MRIIAGTFKGRALTFPKSKEVRPAMDKVRESIFNTLGDVVQNSNVLDLFAGCGSLGFEALSRGASSATFVEINRQALDSIKANAANLHVEDRVKIISKPVNKTLSLIEQSVSPFHLIFLDPPYDTGYLRKTLSQIYEFDILRPFGWIVIEHSKREVPEEAAPYRIVKKSRFGATHITFLFRRT